MRSSKLFLSLASLAALAGQTAFATEYKEIVVDGKVTRRFPMISVSSNPRPFVSFFASEPRSIRHADLTTQINWPIEDQGAVGTCATFASVGVVEYYAKKPFSEECLLRFRAGFDGDFPMKVTADISQYGLAAPKDFTFNDGRNEVDCAYHHDTAYGIDQDNDSNNITLTGSQYVELVNLSHLQMNGKGFVFENINDTGVYQNGDLVDAILGDNGSSFEYIKSQLDKGNPVIIGVALPSSANPQSFILLDNDGNEIGTNKGRGVIDVTPDDTCNGSPVSAGNHVLNASCPGHAIVLVGYDEDKKTFKFRNSWGINWGNEGYGTLSYDYVKDYRWGPTTVVTNQRN